MSYYPILLHEMSFRQFWVPGFVRPYATIQFFITLVFLNASSVMCYTKDCLVKYSEMCSLHDSSKKGKNTQAHFKLLEMCQDWKMCIQGHPQTNKFYEAKLSYVHYIIRKGKAKLCISKLISVMNWLPSVSPKQLCALPHLGCTREVGTS